MLSFQSTNKGNSGALAPTALYLLSSCLSKRVSVSILWLPSLFLTSLIPSLPFFPQLRFCESSFFLQLQLCKVSPFLQLYVFPFQSSSAPLIYQKLAPLLFTQPQCFHLLPLFLQRDRFALSSHLLHYQPTTESRTSPPSCRRIR